MAPVVYFPFAQDPQSAFSIVFRAAAPEAVIPPIREAIAGVDAGLPLYGVQTLRQAMAASPAVFLRSLVMRLLVWFSIAALLLAVVGVYGVLAESVQARTQELGIRQALGATRGDIARLAIGSGLTPALVGGACGLAIAAAAAPAARSLLFGVAPLDLASLAMVGLVIAVSALAACAVPVRRAMTLPPSIALRQD
jgi:putative ABC transport system permease protein